MEGRQINMKRERIILVLASICMILSACSHNGEKQLSEISVITQAQTTDIIAEKTAASKTEASETEADVPENAASETEITETAAVNEEVQTEPIITEPEASDDMTDELMDEVSRLLGALNYIDQIGGGNIPKDENDTVGIEGRQYARVCAQFDSTADLEEFMASTLSEQLIGNRYSHITGGEQPYYIDVDGALYGYVTAKGCGFVWITENDMPTVTISEVSDQSFTAYAKFDNFGGEDEMKLDIVFTDGLWKIDSISYDGMTF